jgi:ATP-dependent Clp protease protease subunit
MNRFWKWVKNKAREPDTGNTLMERTLILNGTIAEESWFDDDVTPALFKSELDEGEGDVTVWINSPGGDCFAAAQIYNMLTSYKGKVTIMIDGLAASAASVIAMAGDKVIISPVGMLMIHNPATEAMGDKQDMEKAIDMLDEVKDSIINAYESKTGLSRNKLSKLMDDETWMDARKAIELGFADEMLSRNSDEDDEDNMSLSDGVLFSNKQMARTFTNKVSVHFEGLVAAGNAGGKQTPAEQEDPAHVANVNDAGVDNTGVDDTVVNDAGVDNTGSKVSDSPYNVAKLQRRLDLLHSIM